MTSLAVIIPTVGRASLADALRSLEGLEPGDQVIVVGDGPQGQAEQIFFRQRRDGWLYLEVSVDPPSSYGNAQRDAAMAIATTDWLCFLDDDDVYTPGALATVRQSVAAQPGRPHIFRMRFGPGHHAHGLVLWQQPEVWASNIGTPMVVLPNRRYETSWMQHDRPGRQGWTSDFGFLSGAIAEAGDPVWRREIVATVRPRPR